MSSASSGHPTYPDLAARRIAIDEAMASQSMAAGVEVETLEEAGFSGVRFVPAGARPGTAIIHFHGGGLRLGSTKGWGPFMTRLAAATRTEVVGVDYALAPEHPYPAASLQAEAAYEFLAAQRRSIVLAGDSAGCNLASGLALRLAERADARHVGTMLFSPWIDLRVQNASYAECAADDALFSREAAEQAAESYAPGMDVADPAISPGLGDWHRQPPVLLETSANEVLRDDARALAQKLLASGVRLWFREVAGQPHDWHIIDPPTPATRDSFASAAAFLDSVQAPES
ncbi:MAG: alpha/beta hydrolase [Aeromicrobium sp.]